MLKAEWKQAAPKLGGYRVPPRRRAVTVGNGAPPAGLASKVPDVAQLPCHDLGIADLVAQHRLFQHDPELVVARGQDAVARRSPVCSSMNAAGQ
jgi:hypothetical protein